VPIIPASKLIKLAIFLFLFLLYIDSTQQLLYLHHLPFHYIHIIFQLINFIIICFIQIRHFSTEIPFSMKYGVYLLSFQIKIGVIDLIYII